VQTSSHRCLYNLASIITIMRIRNKTFNIVLNGAELNKSENVHIYVVIMLICYHANISGACCSGSIATTNQSVE
jgi:hypothetical protein